MDDFCLNLRYLCAEHGTVASLCRKMHFNQQQFSKYLSGKGRPSAHNLRRIAKYFGLRDEDLSKDHALFVRNYLDRKESSRWERGDPLANVFPGNARGIRPFLGAYQVFYISPAAPMSIIVAAAFLDEVEGTVYSRSIEAPFVQEGGRRQWSRGNGKAACHDDRLFVVDVERGSGGSLTSTILVPPHRYKKGYLVGMMVFLASYPNKQPSASKTVWKRAPASLSPKELLKRCRSVSRDSSVIEPMIRQYLVEDASTMQNAWEV